MPDTPDNKVEELLKGYAKKRREDAGAPLELHPATRKLLQDEVAQLRPKPAEESKSWWQAMTLFWPRVGFALSILVGAGLVIWILVPRGTDVRQMARTENGRTLNVEADGDRLAKDLPELAKADAERLRELKPAQSGEKALPTERRHIVDRSGEEKLAGRLEKTSEAGKGLRESEVRLKELAARPAAPASGPPTEGATKRLPASQSGPAAAGQPIQLLSQNRQWGRDGGTQQTVTVNGSGGGGFGVGATGARVAGGTISADPNATVAQANLQSAPKGQVVVTKADGSIVQANFADYFNARTVTNQTASTFAFQAGLVGTNSVLGHDVNLGLTTLTLADGVASGGSLFTTGGLDTTKLNYGYKQSQAGVVDELTLRREPGNESYLKAAPTLSVRSDGKAESSGRLVAAKEKESLGRTVTAANAPKPLANDTKAAGTVTRLETLSVAPAEQQARLGGKVEPPDTSLSRGQPAAFAIINGAYSTAVRQRFNRVSEPAKPGLADKNGIEPAVLTSFELEQAGDRIRIYDSDGSVYEGQLVVSLGDAERKAGELGTDLAKKPKSELTGERKDQFSERLRPTEWTERDASSLLFRASGTNRSLKQLVEINGALISAPATDQNADSSTVALRTIEAAPATPAAAPTINSAPVLSRAASSRASTAGQTASPAAPPPAKAPSQKAAVAPARIQGKARIGGTNEIEIKAVRVSP